MLLSQPHAIDPNLTNCRTTEDEKSGREKGRTCRFPTKTMNKRMNGRINYHEYGFEWPVEKH